MSQCILKRIGHVEAGHAEVVDGVDLELEVHGRVRVVKMADYFVEAPQYHPVYHQDILFFIPLIISLLSTYTLVELDDTEEDPEVDEHADEDVRLHLLYSYDVVHELEEGRQLEPHEDLLDAALPRDVQTRVLRRQLLRLRHQLIKDECAVLDVIMK